MALRSPDAEERRNALNRFYGAVHHQGSVYPCTAASFPFLFELADDVTTPDRADTVELLVSIGSQALGFCNGPYGGSEPHVEAVATMRSRAETLIRLAGDPDVRVRRAAIPALGLFVDDADRASAVLRDRLSAEPDAAEQSLIVEAMASLALRVPDGAGASATTWLAELAADPAVAPQTRLAAVGSPRSLRARRNVRRHHRDRDRPAARAGRCRGTGRTVARRGGPDRPGGRSATAHRRRFRGPRPPRPGPLTGDGSAAHFPPSPGGEGLTRSSRPGSRTRRPPTTSSPAWIAWAPPRDPPCPNSAPNYAIPGVAADSAASQTTRSSRRSATPSSTA